jgi:peptidoglycan/xylan/chitin deacetylase (PgdA/CDA1 family)
MAGTQTKADRSRMSEAAYRLLAGSCAASLVWRLDARRLRILCYHGLCRDILKSANWVPDCFVSLSAFESQMQYLSANSRVLSLAEAVERLRLGTLPPRSVCVTFDDGYANNLQLAYPVLAKYELPATIFLSSSYVESGGFFPFIKLKLIELSLGAEAARKALLSYKSMPLDKVMNRADQWWPPVEAELTRDQLETLRPLTIDEAKAFNPELIELGGHSHTHCILRNESPSRRRQEIVTCTEAVARWTGRPVTLFSYPNGQRQDFDQTDKDILRAHGVNIAVSGIGGANGPDFDPLELRRYPVGLYHDRNRFRVEISGLRSAILQMIRE